MSKYSLAKQALEDLLHEATTQDLDLVEAQDALIITLVQSLKAQVSAAHVRDLLQYELDNLGSGGVHDLPRGGGHS